MTKYILAVFSFMLMLAPVNLRAEDANISSTELKPSTVVKVVEEYDLDMAEAKYKEAKEGASGDKALSIEIIGTSTKTYSDGMTASDDVKFTLEKQDSKFVVTGKEKVDMATFRINNVFIMICACMVFIMHLGFATLETGLTRAKNSINILFKNVAIVAIATLVYAVIGFNLMYPGDWMVTEVIPSLGLGFNVPIDANTPLYNAGYTWYTDFLFQAMFAAATASVVSGAVCERIKLNAFLVFCTVFAGIVYPILGSAHWGGGFLSKQGFADLAGSTLVHSVGGWAALAGAIVLGPRIGKYVDGKSHAIMGHNVPLATIGAMLLWFGWFGFNAGSILSADPAGTSHVMVSTLLSSCGGVVGSMVLSWIVQKKPDLTMILNGALAGLVGITAGADIIGGYGAIIVGLVSGFLVVLAVYGVDKAKIDDPVGAISVHLVCGIWGTIACAPFGGADLLVQLKGIGYYALAFPIAFVIFYIIKVTIGIRVHEEEEVLGLDVGEHGMEAYSGFQIFSNQ